jgi:photosystem II stability/assembly factor-like uncharacterized protein
MKRITLGAVICILFFAANVFAQGTWTPQTSPVTTDINSASAVNTDVCWMCGPSAVVVRTVNGGSSWSTANSGLAGNDFYNLWAISANECWLGAGDGGLWHTTNGGSNWSFIALTPASVFINVVHFFDANNGFIQGDPVSQTWRYYVTTNGGANWTLGANAPTSVGTEAGWNNSYCALDTGHIWWGTNVSKIWKGSFMGPFSSHPTSGSPYSFGVWFNNANTGAACFQVGANKNSTDGGVTWSTASFTPSQTPFALKGIPGTAYMWEGSGTTSAGTIYRSTNNGTSFVSQLNISYAVYGLTFANINCGWAGTAGGHIYKYTDNVGVTNQNHTPTEFTLGQNYPNPFNPQTTIDFSLAKTGYVTIKVYNLLGEKVETLLDGVESSGNHSLIYNASKLPSGTYFYVMKSGDLTAVKSMVLVK